MTTNELIDVTVKIPKPPEGWGDVQFGKPSNGDLVYFQANKKWSEVNYVSGEQRFFCRRKESPYQFPANMADGVMLFPNGLDWLVSLTEVSRSTARKGDWVSDGKNAPATIFADFVPPPERRPYTKGRA